MLGLVAVLGFDICAAIGFAVLARRFDDKLMSWTLYLSAGAMTAMAAMHGVLGWIVLSLSAAWLTV